MQIHQNDKISFLPEEGSAPQDFVVEALFFVNRKQYAVLAPENKTDGQDSFLYQHCVKNGESLLLPIEDDDEWECVADFYQHEIKK